MKALFLTLISIGFILSAKPQQRLDSAKLIANDTTIYISADQSPSFPGGLPEFYKYLAKTIRYPKDAYMHGIEGKVIIQMVIEKDGSLSNIIAIRSPSPLLTDEGLRVMKGCPNWIPATTNGQKVRMSYAVPILFQLNAAAREFAKYH